MKRIERSCSVCELSFAGLVTFYVNRTTALEAATEIISTAHPSWYDSLEIHARGGEAMIRSWNESHPNLRIEFQLIGVMKIVGVSEKSEA